MVVGVGAGAVTELLWILNGNISVFLVWFRLGCFQRIRAMVGKHCVLHHPDLIAAMEPNKSGRPFEMFVDANDYGWSGSAGVRCFGFLPMQPGFNPSVVHDLAKLSPASN